MATLPTSEQTNRLFNYCAPADKAGCSCTCHTAGGRSSCGCCGGPALGLKARPDTFGELLPGVRHLVDQLQKLAEAGKLAEVDLCLLHLLEDWIVASKAEIDQAKST